VTFVRFLYLLAVGVWVGEVVFFSFVVAPSVFGVLPSADAGKVVGAIFPRYYALGAGAGTVALVAAMVLARGAALARWWTGAALAIAVGLAATAWAGVVVHPEAQRVRAAAEARGEAPSNVDAFRQAHRLAMILNSIALVGGLAGLGLSAAALRQ
jgi:uncharacterized membrane protein